MRLKSEQKFLILRRIQDLPVPERREIKRVYLHHSLSKVGDAEEIDHWHRNREPRPFNEIGYNTVVNCGARDIRPDIGFPGGLVQIGRDVEKSTAQVLGDNKRSLGLCIVGVFDKKFQGKSGEVPDGKGVREKVAALVLITYCRKLDLPLRQVLGHREAKYVPGVPNPRKSCPGDRIDCDAMRYMLYRVSKNHYESWCEWYEQLVIDFDRDHPGYKFLEV